METMVLFRYEKQVRSHHVQNFGDLNLISGRLDEIRLIAKEFYADVNKQNVCIVGACREWAPESIKCKQVELLDIIKEGREKGKTDPQIILEALENDMDSGYEIKKIIAKEMKYRKEMECMEMEHQILLANKRKSEVYGRMHLKSWQREMETLFHRPPTSRLIHIISDVRGGSGKTQWKSYMGVQYSSKILTLTPSKTDDILHHAAMQYGTSLGPRMIICDVQRSQPISENLLGACELLKDGEFFSGKYNGKYVSWEHPPHIVLLTNASFDLVKEILKVSLSFDRVRVGIMESDCLKWFRLETYTFAQREWTECSMLLDGEQEDDGSKS
jgi:hypothetical protein